MNAITKQNAVDSQAALGLLLVSAKDGQND